MRPGADGRSSRQHQPHEAADRAGRTRLHRRSPAGLRVRGRAADLCWEGDASLAIERALSRRDYGLVALSFRNTGDCYSSGETFYDILKSDVAEIKRHYDGPVVIGGTGFSVRPIPILEYMGLDYGVVGEGENALEGFLPFLVTITSYPISDNSSVIKLTSMRSSSAKRTTLFVSLLSMIKIKFYHPASFFNINKGNFRCVRYDDPEEQTPLSSKRT